MGGREREREREREMVCTCVGGREREMVCMCVGCVCVNGDGRWCGGGVHMCVKSEITIIIYTDSRIWQQVKSV